MKNYARQAGGVARTACRKRREAACGTRKSLRPRTEGKDWTTGAEAADGGQSWKPAARRQISTMVRMAFSIDGTGTNS